MSSPAGCFAPIIRETGAYAKLAMQRLWLTGQVLPAGARLTVEHIFESGEQQPLEVIYSFALPRDAALRSFRVTGEGFEAHSELKETQAAVKVYEEGLAQGSLSTLARMYGDGVVNLTVGNIRPGESVTVLLDIVAGVELHDDGFRFRFPFTLSPTYHAEAKSAVIDGEMERELPSKEFGDVILPRYRKDGGPLHQVGFDLNVSTELPLEEVSSPSHAVRVRGDKARSRKVMLAVGSDIPDRDLVLETKFGEIKPQVLAGRDHEGKVRFAAVVPSQSFGARDEAPKRVVILLDRSGSMGGDPITQAKKAIQACLGVLSESDQFSLIAFDDRIETLSHGLLNGSKKHREEAQRFLEGINARGGTELANGVVEAAKLLSKEGGDIFILTDGQVAGTEAILSKARETGIRLHCLGIGSASQDRFLALLARETDGVSRFVTPRERVDLSAVDLFASIGRPAARGLKAHGNIQPAPTSTVYAGTPVLLFGEDDGETSRIELEWDGGKMTLPIAFDDNSVAETVWLL